MDPSSTQPNGAPPPPPISQSQQQPAPPTAGSSAPTAAATSSQTHEPLLALLQTLAGSGGPASYTQMSRDQIGMQLLKRMPEFIKLEQQGVISSEQLEKLKDAARTFAPRLVQIATAARMQATQNQANQQAQQAAQQPGNSLGLQLDSRTGPSVPVQRFEGPPTWQGLPPHVIFAPPNNLPVPNRGTSIPPPYSQNPPPAFNLHMPPARNAPPASAPSPARPPENIWPQPTEELADDAKQAGQWGQPYLRKEEDPWEGTVEREVVGRYSTWPITMKGTEPRPTLSLGLADGFGGSVLGTAPYLAPPGFSLEDARSPTQDATGADGELMVPRSISDLLQTLQPEMGVESGAEDFLLAAADEFITSVTGFAADMARHRGADTLEAKDLQLHLERNYNIRIPGYAADDIRLALSHTPAGTGKLKAGGGASGPGVRAARLAAAQALAR